MRIVLLLIICLTWQTGFGQVADSSFSGDTAIITVPAIRDSVHAIDSGATTATTRVIDLNYPRLSLLKENFLLNGSLQKPAAFAAVPRKRSGQEFDFYFLVSLFAFAGILRAVYPRYFANMFRVFFNTSLRQGQLTDQLLQAKLASMLFNLFFAFSTGFFIYQFLKFANIISKETDIRILFFLITALTLMYSCKYLVLKFTGWMSGFGKEADTYIFIVFLVNKIMGIVLLPLSLVLAFSDKGIAGVVAVLSLMVVLVLFLLRFFRSYGNLQHRIQVNRFHFFLYIIGVEILPLLLIYKAAVGLLLNNA